MIDHRTTLRVLLLAARLHLCETRTKQTDSSIRELLNAGMAELADAADSKSADPCGRGGSTPPPGTNKINGLDQNWPLESESQFSLVAVLMAVRLYGFQPSLDHFPCRYRAGHSTLGRFLSRKTPLQARFGVPSNRENGLACAERRVLQS
jgi:hypothetical protein